MPRNCAKITLLTLSLLTSTVWASGGNYPTAVFYHTFNPPELKRLYGGEIGILLPSFDSRHLTVAYRWFNGGTLSTAQAESLSEYPARVNQLDDPNPKIEAWLAAREALGLGRIKLDADFHGGDYIYEPNCSTDAFVRATETLHQLTARYGKNESSVLNWVTAQDAVFTNCSGTGTLPAPSVSTDPAWLRFERDYQIASALYYRHDYSGAEKVFQRLAGEGGKEYAALANYLAARAAVHQAIAVNSTETPDSPRTAATTAAYTHATQALGQLAALGDSYPYQLPVIRLRGLLEASINPRARALQLDEELASKPLSANAWQDLFDYTLLAPEYAPDSAIFSWITNLRSDDHDSALLQAERTWQKSHKQLWLINILSHAAWSSGNIDKALQSASRIPATSPLYFTVNYYRIRALKHRGRAAQARQLAEQLISNGKLDPSSQNLLSIELAQLSTTPDEFVAFSIRRPVSIESLGETNGYEGTWELWANDSRLNWREEFVNHDLRYIPPSTAMLMSHLPYATLQEMLTHEWPTHIARKLTTTLWTRALLSDKLTVMNGLAERLESYFPDQRQLLHDFILSKDEGQRRFLATLMVLRYPDMDVMLSGGLERDFPPHDIGAYGKRWWQPGDMCEIMLDTSWEWESEICRTNHSTSPALPPFVDAKSGSEARKEMAAFANTPAIATFSGKIVTAYAKSHPDDSYVPEALHLVVRASRYGATDAQSSHYSRLAFSMLHKQYAKSEWSSKTPHWY